MRLFLYTYDVKANKSVLEDITDHDLHKVPLSNVLIYDLPPLVYLLIKAETAADAMKEGNRIMLFSTLNGQSDETEINMFNNNEPLLELIADEEQFKVQSVNHDNDADCDGMCCSDCTVSNCPVRDCKIIVKHM